MKASDWVEIGRFVDLSITQYGFDPFKFRDLLLRNAELIEFVEKLQRDKPQKK